MNKILTTNTDIIYSIYEFHKENSDVSTQHSQLIKRFKDAVAKLSDMEQTTISWEVKNFYTTSEQGIKKKMSSIFMNKETALWFASLVNHSLRLRIIKKLSNQPSAVKSFNTTKIEELGKVAKSLMTIADAIIAMKDDTVLTDNLEDNQQIIESEIIKTDGVVVSSSEKIITKHVHQTSSEYYNLPVTNLYNLPIDNPAQGVVELTYYNDNYGIWNREGTPIKIPLTQAIKALGFTQTVKLYVTYSRTSTKGYFTVNKVMAIDGIPC